MRLTLDKGAKRVLLQAIKDGYIDSRQLWNIQNGLKAEFEDKTDADLERDLLELERKLYPETCLMLQRAGLCYELNKRKETI